jgi:hypothetical protein
MTLSRRAGMMIFLVLACLILADTAAWFWATGRMVTAWDAWRSQMAVQGVTVQAGPPARGGWPFAAELLLPGIGIDNGVAAWRADSVRLDLSLLHPMTLAIDVDGPQTIRVDGLPPITVTARGVTAAIPLNNPGQINFEAHSIATTLAGGSLQISVLAGRFDPAGLEIAASQLTLPNAGLPFGGAIERASARLRMVGKLPSAADIPHPAAAAADWARAGGQVVVDDATLVWGPLDAQGHFSAGLDPALQPTGSGSLHMSGYHAAIDALVRAGTIGRNAARVATTVLDMMATNTDPAVVDIPLTLRGGTVAMGAIPLVRFAPVAWPQ